MIMMMLALQNPILTSASDNSSPLCSRQVFGRPRLPPNPGTHVRLLGSLVSVVSMSCGVSWRSRRRQTKNVSNVKGTRSALADTVDSFLLDLDGVLFEGNKPVPGSREAILALRAAGKRIFCVTNNAARTREQVAAKIQHVVNVPIAESEVVTSAWAAAAALKADLVSGQKVYACGEEEGLLGELANAGVAYVTTPYEQSMSEGDFEKLANGGLDPDVAAVCLGFDSSFTYAKLCIASLYIQRGAMFYCTNTDAYNKVGGARMPRTGCWLDALQRAVGQDATVVGKPSGKFMDQVVDRYELDRSRTLMVGDRLDTDIAFGNRNGVQTCLVLSGVSTQADVDVLQGSDERIPNYVRADLQALLLS